MSKASTGFAFVAGLTIGAAGAWYYLKDKYAKLAEEEIASVKAAYAKREKPTTEEKTVSVVNAAKHMDKGSITEYTQRLQEAGYKDYSERLTRSPLERLVKFRMSSLLMNSESLKTIRKSA